MTDTSNIKNSLLFEISASDSPREVLKNPELKDLYAAITSLPKSERARYGSGLNQMKQELEEAVARREKELESGTLPLIDVTAPWDNNVGKPSLLPTNQGTQHPLTSELEVIIDIFTRMGFEVHESRQIDNDWNMFGALNFPPNHPARDGYDTFKTEEGFLPPAHTSTMQNRVLKAGKDRLEAGGYIASVSYGRVFRNEDVDQTHEHTFYQQEGIYVSKSANLGNMIALLKSFYESYFGQAMNIKTQPGYFPFVEPGLEFCIERPASIDGKAGDWLEMLGCGMIHPNVLEAAGIDHTLYRGFAWGGGVERMIMLRHGIEDLRHFESGKLQFLRKFV